MIVGFFNWIGRNLEFGWQHWVRYTFRKRSPFRLPIRYLSLSIIAELGELIQPDYFDPLVDYVTTHYSEIHGVILDVFVNFALGNFLIGFSILSISIKIALLVFMCVLEWSKDKTGKYTLKISVLSNNRFFSPTTKNYIDSFEVNKKWFHRLYNNDSSGKDAKFNSRVHQSGVLENKIFEQIIQPEIDVSKINTLLFRATDRAVMLEMDLSSFLKLEDVDERYKLNKTTSLFQELKSLHQEIIELISRLKLFEQNVESEEKAKILELRTESYQINSLSIEKANLSEKINASEFDLLSKSEEFKIGKPQDNRDFFKLLYPIVEHYSQLKEALTLFDSKKTAVLVNYAIVHAKAGIGKTHFSNNLFKRLYDSDHYPILLKGIQFSNCNSITEALKGNLSISNQLDLQKILEKFNDFAKKKSKKVVFIFDGINETTMHGSGFSPIWKEYLSNLLTSISSFENIHLIITCRTSYFERIEGDQGLKSKFQLDGFNTEAKRLEAVKSYFKEYNIQCETLENIDLSIFELPLVLNVFCRSKNSSKDKSVFTSLDTIKYHEILNELLMSESNRISNILDYPTITPIVNGIHRNSSKLLENRSATLSIEDYLTITDNKEIEAITRSNSIGFRMLESELLFMKDLNAEDDSESVVHTFQNLGGYLISKYIFKEFSNGQNIIAQNFFQSLQNTKEDYYGNPIVENPHQLSSDIIEFLVALSYYSSDDLIDHSKDLHIFYHTWLFVIRNPREATIQNLVEKLHREMDKDITLTKGFLEAIFPTILNAERDVNFQYVQDYLKLKNQFDRDMIWNKFIFENYEEINESLIGSLVKLNNNDIDSEKWLDNLTDFCCWTLESTLQELRDKASVILLRIGERNINLLLDRLPYFLELKVNYICQRLALMLYGTVLLKKNNPDFINNQMQTISRRLFDIQFNTTSKISTYDYIVIDSFKHIIDLAIAKGKHDLTSEEAELVNDYNFCLPFTWSQPTGAEQTLIRDIVSEGYTKKGPDPLRMDFVIYTIPRLVMESKNNEYEATANIFKRIKELGYPPELHKKIESPNIQEFFFGGDSTGSTGKIERLGKKYSWMAYFEYAGHLLKHKELPVFTEGDSSVEPHYQRFSEIRIEPSHPSSGVIKKKLYTGNLLPDMNSESDWVNEAKFEESKKLWRIKEANQQWSLLYGYFEQKHNKPNEVRSYIQVESFFVKKEEVMKFSSVTNQAFDWKNEIRGGDSLYYTYFGELYWADTVPIYKPQKAFLETGVFKNVKRALNQKDLIYSDKYSDKKVGDMIEENVEEQVNFFIEPTLLDYVFEVESDYMHSLRKYIPHPNMARYLGFLSDPKNMNILDSDLDEVLLTTTFENQEGHREDFSFVREDQIKKYMKEHDFILLYQIKQHTYEKTEDKGYTNNMSLKFFINETL